MAKTTTKVSIKNQEKPINTNDTKPKRTPKAKTTDNTTNQPAQPITQTTQEKNNVKTQTNNTIEKKRHFYVYYNGAKLENTRLSGKRPKQAAQKALSSIIKFEKKENNNDIIGKDIKFYIIETGRKKWREKTIGDKTKKVLINKRMFYYKGKKEHIPTDLKDNYYKDKTINIFEEKLDENNKVIYTLKETKGQNKKASDKTNERSINVILTNDNKVDCILISKKETKKTTKDGKTITIPATFVKYQYITNINRDKDVPKAPKPKITTKQKKITKSKTQKKTATKKQTTKTKTKTQKKTQAKKQTTKTVKTKAAPKKTEKKNTKK